MAMGIYDRLCSRQTSVGVVGLGYVGMPIALEMAKHFNVVGFDSLKKIHNCKSIDYPPHLRRTVTETGRSMAAGL